MATPFIPLNNGSVPLIQGPAIGSSNSVIQYTTSNPATGNVLADDFLYGFVDTLDYQGTPGTYFHAVFGVGNTQPVDYWFNCNSIGAFTAFLTGAGVTNSFVTYNGCNGIKVANNRNPAISILVNPNNFNSGGYYPPSNQTNFVIAPNSKNYPKFQLFFTGNPLTTGVVATGSLAVPIANVTQAVAATGTATVTVGTVTPGDTFTVHFDSVNYLYTAVTGDTPTSILAKTLANLNLNTNGFHWTGTNTTGVLNYTATNTLANGASANGVVITTSITGTTFSSNSGSTTSGGVNQGGNGDTMTGYIRNPNTGQTYTVGTVSVVPGSTQATLKTAVDAMFNSNTLGFSFVGTLAANVNTEAITAPTTGSYYNGWTVYFTPTGSTFGSSTVTATMSGGA